jgi:predicted lipoprotein with Yx(FWY)xxD motif
MTRTRTPFLATAAAALIALVAAGCGGSADATTTPPTTERGASATIGVASTDLGDVLVDSRGRTLYLFEKDTGASSTCGGACASDWPPLRVNGEPKIGTGVSASLVATSARSDGEPQLTYDGHPLYLFAGDGQPGETNGHGSDSYGAAWYAVTAAGDPATGEQSGSQGGAAPGGGY